MLNVRLLLIVAIILIVQLIVNILLSREIFNWIPDIKLRIQLFILLWLLPLFGIFFVYRIVKPGWFVTQTQDSSGQSSISSGLMGLDAIFNPSSKHIADVGEKSEITIKMEGEMFDNDLPEFIDLDDDNTVP